MGGGHFAAGAANDSRVSTVRGMPSEAGREALQDLAAGVLGDELLDDRFPPDTQGTTSNPSHSSDSSDSCDSDLSVSSSAAWQPPSPEERAERGAALLGQIVDVFVGARRLAAWSLWLQLAAAAHLIGRWQASPRSSTARCPTWSRIPPPP